MKGSKLFYENYQGFSELGSDKASLRDTRGCMRTKSLFVEFEKDCGFKYKPTYTLKEDERDDYPSAYKIYITSIDEADAALRLVGSLSHWRRLTKLKWFVNGMLEHGYPGLASWREDMKARDDTAAKRILMEAANMGNVTAAKALRDYGTVKSKPSNTGKKEDSIGDQNVVDFQKELDKL